MIIRTKEDWYSIAPDIGALYDIEDALLWSREQKTPLQNYAPCILVSSSWALFGYGIYKLVTLEDSEELIQAFTAQYKEFE